MKKKDNNTHIHKQNVLHFFTTNFTCFMDDSTYFDKLLKSSETNKLGPIQKKLYKVVKKKNIKKIHKKKSHSKEFEYLKISVSLIKCFNTFCLKA